MSTTERGYALKVTAPTGGEWFLQARYKTYAPAKAHADSLNRCDPNGNRTTVVEYEMREVEEVKSE